MPSVRQYRVLVVQKNDNDEEVQSVPSPVAQFNTQRTPTDSPRKRSIKPVSGQSTPSSLASGRSTSNTVNARASSSNAQSVRVVPPHKLSLYKRFKRFIFKQSINERDGAFIVLVSVGLFDLKLHCSNCQNLYSIIYSILINTLSGYFRYYCHLHRFLPEQLLRILNSKSMRCVDL